VSLLKKAILRGRAKCSFISLGEDAERGRSRGRRVVRSVEKKSHKRKAANEEEVPDAGVYQNN